MIEGIIPIIAVPFTKDGEVDYIGYENIIDYLIQRKVPAITLFGLASEFSKLSDEERFKLAKILTDKTKDTQCKSIMSITDHSYEVARKHAKYFEEIGSDCLMIFPPHFLSPAPNAIIKHINEVCKATKLPVIVQYAPNQTGVKISVDIFVDIRKNNHNFKYLKIETQPPGKYLSEVKKNKIEVDSFVGYAGVQMPDFLSRGGKGIQPGCSFIELYIKLWNLWSEGLHKEFDELFQRMLPYITCWMQGVEFIIQVEKTILMKRGIIETDVCRHPGYSLDEQEINMIDRFLEEFKEELGGK